jgi:hypothetical protein
LISALDALLQFRVRRGHPASRDLLVRKVKKETQESKGLQEFKESKDHLVRKETQDHKDLKVSKDRQAQLAQ